MQNNLDNQRRKRGTRRPIKNQKTKKQPIKYLTRRTTNRAHIVRKHNHRERNEIMSNENIEVIAAREALNAARIDELSRILPIYRTREQAAELDRLKRISPTVGALSAGDWPEQETPEPVAAPKASSTRPPKRRKSRTWLGVTAAGVLGLGLGAGVGASQVPEPETRVETKIETETEIVEVETTPDVCLSALKGSDEIVDLHATYVGYVGNILDAASVQNLVGVESAGDFMAATNDDMLDVIREYVADRDACQGAAS